MEGAGLGPIGGVDLWGTTGLDPLRCSLSTDATVDTECSTVATASDDSEDLEAVLDRIDDGKGREGSVSWGEDLSTPKLSATLSFAWACWYTASPFESFGSCTTDSLRCGGGCRGVVRGVSWSPPSADTSDESAQVTLGESGCLCCSTSSPEGVIEESEMIL